MDEYRNYHIGMIFQEFNLIESITVRENIMIALHAQHSGNSCAFEVSSVLKMVDLSGYEDRYVNSLSGGERQRIAISRAMVKHPSIILADEPTGNLDSENSKLVFDYLKKISEDTLVIVATHDREFAYSYADRVISLVDGNVVDDKQLVESNDLSLMPAKNEHVNKIARLGLGFHLKFALRNILTKKVRMMLSIITFTLALFLINMGLVFYMYDFDRVTYHILKEASIEEMVIFKTVDTEDETEYITFMDNELHEISNEYSDFAFTRIICKPLGTNAEFNSIFKFTNYSPEIPSDQLNIKTIMIVENGASNLTYSSGDSPDKLGAVAISDYLADMIIKYQIFDNVDTHDDLITKILDNGISSIEISGIYDTNYEYKYSQDSSVSELYDNGFIVDLNTTLCTLVMTEETYESFFNSVGKILTMQEGNYSYNNVVMTNSNSVFAYPVIGELPDADDEIAVSLSFLDNYLTETIIPGDITGDNEAIREYLDEVVSLNLDAYNLGMCNFTIVGIIDDFNQGNNIQLTFAKNVYDNFEYNNTIDGKMIGLKLDFDSQTTDYNDIVRLLNDNHARHYTKYSFELYGMSSVEEKVSPLLETSGLVLIFISGMMISSYISYTIQTKKREIGILRSLGFSTSEVTKIYLLQSFIMLFISYILSLCFAYISVIIQNQEIAESWNLTIKLLYLDPIICLISFFFIVFISLISTLIPVHRFFVMQPIKAIRQGEV